MQLPPSLKTGAFVILNCHVSSIDAHWFLQCTYKDCNMTAQNELNKEDTSGHATVDKEKPMKPNPTQRSTGNQEKLGMGEVIFPREVCPVPIVCPVTNGQL